MKRWLKRTLIGVFGASVLFGGLGRLLASLPPRRRLEQHERRRRRQAQGVDDRSREQPPRPRRRAKAKLGALADQLRAQRQALAGGTDPRAEIQSLVAGNTFDRTKAKALHRRQDADDSNQEPRADRRARRLLRQPDALSSSRRCVTSCREAVMAGATDPGVRASPTDARMPGEPAACREGRALALAHAGTGASGGRAEPLAAAAAADRGACADDDRDDAARDLAVRHRCAVRPLDRRWRAVDAALALRGWRGRGGASARRARRCRPPLGRRC